MMGGRRIKAAAAEVAGLVAGFAVWSAAFVLLYSLHGLACADPPRIDAVRPALVGGWAVMLAGQGALTWWLGRRWRSADDAVRFVRLVSFALSVAALGATVWTGLPVAVLRVC